MLSVLPLRIKYYSGVVLDVFSGRECPTIRPIRSGFDQDHFADNKALQAVRIGDVSTAMYIPTRTDIETGERFVLLGDVEDVFGEVKGIATDDGSAEFLNDDGYG